jgi:hypothetical protein
MSFNASRKSRTPAIFSSSTRTPCFSAQIQAGRQAHLMKRGLLQEGGGDDGAIALPLGRIGVVLGPLRGEARIEVGRHDVLEPLAALNHQKIPLRDQQPEDPHDADLEGLGYHHLIRGREQALELLRAPGDSLGQRRHAAENPQIGRTVADVPHARSGALAGDDHFVQDGRPLLGGAAEGRSEKSRGQQQCAQRRSTAALRAGGHRFRACG